MAVIDKDKIIHGITDGFSIEDYQISFDKEEVRTQRVVFMGTPQFAVPILEGLIANYQVVLVVCQPDKKKDRKGRLVYPEVKRVALEHNIEVFQPTSIRDSYQTILDKNPDIIITCAYGQMIPMEVINFPKYGCINVHGSLLPALRGGAPIHWAIIQGLKKTGITIMSMAKKMDAGDIIAQASLEILDEDILDTLYEKMSFLGRDLLLETLPSIFSRTCCYQVQDESKVTFGFNVTREDAKICFNKTGEEIRNLVRGLNSTPGAYCYLDDKRVKIYDVDYIKEEGTLADFGQIVRISKDGIFCRCLDGVVQIKELAFEGKKRCKVQDYLNGVFRDDLLGKVFL